MKRWLKRLSRSLNGDTKVVRAKGHHRDLGDAARARGDWESAGRHYAFHLAEAPQDFDIWVQLGHSLKERELLDQADLAYAQAARLDGANPDPLVHRGHMAKGRRDYASARDHFTAVYAINRDPDIAREMNWLDAQLAAGRSEPSRTASAGQDPGRVLRAIDIYNGAMLDIWSTGSGDAGPADSGGRLKALEDENGRLKGLLAQSMLEAAEMKGRLGQH